MLAGSGHQSGRMLCRIRAGVKHDFDHYSLVLEGRELRHIPMYRANVFFDQSSFEMITREWTPRDFVSDKMGNVRRDWRTDANRESFKNQRADLPPVAARRRAGTGRVKRLIGTSAPASGGGASVK